MVAREIHLEWVKSLDSDSLINALQRSINRRGDRPNTVVSDCSYNFKGGNKKSKFKLPGFNQVKITRFTLKQSIKLKFNPTNVPHVDGF